MSVHRQSVRRILIKLLKIEVESSLLAQEIRNESVQGDNKTSTIISIQVKLKLVVVRC